MGIVNSLNMSVCRKKGKKHSQRQKTFYGQDVSTADLARVGLLATQFSLAILPV